MREYREYPARFVEQTALTSQHLRQGRFLDRMKDRVRLVFIGIVTGGDLWGPDLRCVFHLTIWAVLVGDLSPPSSVAGLVEQ